MASKPRVRVIGTGGTISSIGHHRLDFTRYPSLAQRISVQESLDRVPEVGEVADVTSENLFSVSSGSIRPNQWIEMANRINQVFTEEPEVDGIVLTHGTGTMEEAAYFLHLTVKSPKPVVMTGSMRPVSAMGTDADVNLYNAIRIAAWGDSGGRGVMTCLNSQIHSGRDVTKTDPLRLETFQGHDMGLLGYADPDGEVVFYRRPQRKHTIDTPFEVAGLGELPRVDIVPLYAGCDDLLLNAVRQQKSAGVVIAAVGGGSGEGVIKERAMEAMEEGMAVVLASRTPNGRVVITPERAKEGFIGADNLLPQKARILLMLALTVTSDREALQRMFYEF